MDAFTYGAMHFCSSATRAQLAGLCQMSFNYLHVIVEAIFPSSKRDIVNECRKRFS